VEKTFRKIEIGKSRLLEKNLITGYPCLVMNLSPTVSQGFAEKPVG